MGDGGALMDLDGGQNQKEADEVQANSQAKDEGPDPMSNDQKFSTFDHDMKNETMTTTQGQMPGDIDRNL